MLWFKKVKEEGFSLRLSFIVMVVVSVVLTVVLLAMSFHTISSFHQLSDATDAFIDLQDAAYSLMDASDYLTEEAQSYTVMGERKHLDNYFTEAEQTLRRDKAVEVMESHAPDSAALEELKGAMNESLSLMDREYYAMMLVLTALGDDDIPQAMQGVVLTDEDMLLSSEDKKALAERMLHDDEYYTQKNLIRSHLGSCIAELKNGTHHTQRDMDDNMRLDLIWMTVLIVLQSLGLILMLWMTTSLGINPLLKAVEHIKRNQNIPIMGANEFRYLAGTYNRMYNAYKRSIEHLSYKASHDELTDVYNRTGYDLIIDSIDLNTTAYLLFDADNFKTINDEMGHERGDAMIIKIASVIKQYFRSDDYVCRIGGDEFAVLMIHTDKSRKRLIERKISQINRELADTGDGLPATSVSVGVSFCDGKKDAGRLYHEADLAMYSVKESGRGGCAFYEPSMEDH